MSYPNVASRLAGAFLLVEVLLSCARQGGDSALQQIRAAEDARGRTPDALQPIFAALRTGTASGTIATALRAVGRLQRAAFVDSLAPFLTHSDVRVRLEAANAIAQSVQSEGDTTAVVRARALLDARLVAVASDIEHGVVARSLGRLPHESAAKAQEAADRIAQAVVPSFKSACVASAVQIPDLDSTNADLVFGALHGIYAVARRHRILGCSAVPLARAAATYRMATAGDTVVWVRELALLALQAANQADTSVLFRALRDPDPRVRRLGVRVTRETPATVVLRVASAGLGDPAAMVRIDAVRALLVVRSSQACALATRALQDRNSHVRTEAVDAVAAACTANVAQQQLDSLVRLLPADTADAAMTWHAPARALVALARTSSGAAAPHFARFQLHPVWQVRAALAAAATALGDSATLLVLLQDRDANVREETIALLAQLGGSLRERAVRSGLGSTAYQEVLAAAQAAKDVPAIDVQALAAALGRLTTRSQETSRDARRELLERIAERGAVADSAALRPYVTDFDTLIARRSGEVLSLWTGRLVAPAPQPQPLRQETLSDTNELRLRVTLSAASGGGVFLVRLFAGEAPATVARVARLAREGYFDGRTFHRVVPNFVIQGGSPDANEYVGDGPFMRDELGLRSHTRGTLGISTRGRDTGDAQLFVNLIDNFRLDHDYTVFGEIIEGMDVIDSIQAGAVLASVEVVGPRR